MKPREKKLYMDLAQRMGQMSYCHRAQVGCVVVKEDNIISYGWNGTPAGEDNCCEDEHGISKPNVIHAEDNALRKLTRTDSSSKGAEVFVTIAPCIRCAEKLSDARVSKVYYAALRKGRTVGIEHLQRHDIEVEHLEQ